MERVLGSTKTESVLDVKCMFWPGLNIQPWLFYATFLSNSQRARARFWLWITKVPGPTNTLHILNAERALITAVWGAVYLYLGEIYGRA